LQNNSAGCVANNDRIVRSAFQFLIAFPNSMAPPDVRHTDLIEVELTPENAVTKFLFPLVKTDAFDPATPLRISPSRD
jgi:hypothetical protein